jgi:hypothetical protein
MALETDSEIKKVTRQLEIPFTNIDYSDMGKEFEEITKSLGEAKTELKKCQDDLKELSKRAEKGFKNENVTCEMKLFYKNRLVQIMYGDQLVEERAMTDAEFQQEFREFEPKDEDDKDEFAAEEQELTPEEAKQDLEDVIRDEKKSTKVVHT